MTLKTAKKRIKQLEQDVIDLQLQFENLDERFSRVDALAKASAPYIADPNTIPMGGSNIVSEPELLKKKAQQLFEDLQAQTTQAVLEEAEWWAAQAGHTGPVHPDMLDEDCAMCYRIVKLRGGRVGSYRDKQCEHSKPV